MYSYAMQPSTNIEIITVRSADRGAVVASALLHGHLTALPSYLPSPRHGGILSGILINTTIDASDVLSNLLQMAIGRCSYLEYPSLECRLVRTLLRLLLTPN